MESIESKTTGSCWEVGPNSSKWLAENLKEMDLSVKRMLKLIEKDGSVKPKLISNVEEFHQLYRSLAERYDHMTRESCKSVTHDSGDSEPVYGQGSPLQTPDVRVQDQSAGVNDTSPSSPGADSVFSLKEGSESASLSSSSSDSDSESFVTSYLRTPLSINSQSLHQKMTQLETELAAAKDGLQTREADLELEREHVSELQRRVVDLESRVSDSESVRGFLGAEIEKLKLELVHRTAEGNKLQNQLEVAREEAASLEAQLGSEKEHVLELEEMIARYDADLSDRDLEVWELKVALRDAEEQFTQDKARLESDILSLSEKLAQVDIELGESEAEKVEMKSSYKAQVNLSDQLKVELAAKTEQVRVLSEDFDRSTMKHDALVATLSDQIREMESYISQLHERCGELVEESREAREVVDELKPRVEALQSEVDRQRVVIFEGAEEKREAIRQLCFSIEHYRTGYQELRQAFVGNKRSVVIAA